MKTVLVIDLLAFLPTILKFMDPDYAVFKNFRLYHIGLLYYPLEWLIYKFPLKGGEH